MSAPLSIADFTSSNVEKPGILWTLNLVFFKFFFASLIASLLETFDFPIVKLDAPSPLPWPTSRISILYFSANLE